MSKDKLPSLNSLIGSNDIVGNIETVYISYGKMTIDPKKDIPLFPPDPNYCGLEPITTGPNDPWWKRKVCQTHDKAYQKLKDNEWRVFGRFALDIGKGMLDGAIMLITGIPYLLIGGLGGVVRYQQLKRRRKLKEQNDNLPPDLGDNI